MASPEYVLKLLHPRGITIRPAGTIPLSAGILRELLGNPTDAEVREKLKSVYIPDNADELREDLTTMLRAIANKGEWERSIYEKYYLLDNRASGHGHKRIVLPTYQAKDNVNSNIAFPLPLTFNRSLSGIPISNEIFFRDPQSGDTGIQTLFPDHHYVYRPDPKTPLASLTPFRALPAFRSGARLGGALISGPPYFLHKSKADATAGSLSAAENYIALLASGILLERLWLLYFTVPEGEPIILANEFPFIYLMISCGNLIRLYQADVRWPYDASGRLSRDLNPNGKTEVRFDVQTLLYTCDLLLPSDISILREWLNLIHYYGATLHYQWLDQLAARAVTDPRLQGRAWTDLISDHCFVYRHDGIHLRRRKEKLQGGGQRASSKAESQRSAKRKVRVPWSHSVPNYSNIKSRWIMLLTLHPPQNRIWTTTIT